MDTTRGGRKLKKEETANCHLRLPGILLLSCVQERRPNGQGQKDVICGPRLNLRLFIYQSITNVSNHHSEVEAASAPFCIFGLYI